MSVDFTNVNSIPPRHYTTASQAVHVDAGEDFTCIANVYFESGSTGEHWYYLSVDGIQTSGSIAMYRSGGGIPGKPASWLGTGAVLSTTEDFINNAPVLDILLRRNGILTRGHIALGTTQLIVVTQSNSQAINASGSLFIGARSDLDVNREWHGRISDVVFSRGYGATGDELIALANGKPLEDCRNLWRTRQFHAHLKTAKVPQLVDLTGNFVLTRQNSGYGENEGDPKLFVRRSTKLKIPPLLSAFAAQQGAPGALLLIDGLQHGHTLLSPQLTQQHIVTINDLLHSHNISSPTITQQHVLAIFGLAQTSSISSPPLTQAATVAANGIAHTSSISEITLTQQHALSLFSLAHDSSISSPILSVAGSLSTNILDHASQISALNLLQKSLLQVGALTHSTVLESIQLTTGISIAVSNLASGSLLTSPGVTQAHVIAIDNLLHQHSIDNVNIGASSIELSVADLLSGSNIDGITLPQSVIIAINNLLSNHVIDGVSFTEQATITVASMTHPHTLQNVIFVRVVFIHAVQIDLIF